MLRVMLVDDEPIIKAVFRKMIRWEDEGFQIVGTASNGQEALRLLAQCPADIVITDLKMPHMDGIALIEALKERRFEGVILVLSNYSDFELVRRALVAGAADYLLKTNLSATELLNQLQRARDVVADRRQIHRREQLVAENSAVLRTHALRGLLLSAQPPADALPAALSEPYAPGRGPFCLSVLLLLPHAQRVTAGLPSLASVESVLRSIFEDMPDADILILGEREICCIHPVCGADAAQCLPASKQRQIIRQIGMYFNAAVLLLTPPPADTLAGLWTRRQSCLPAARRAFYVQPSAAIDPLLAACAPLPDGISPQGLARRLAEECAFGDDAALAHALEDLLDACRAVFADPPALCAALAQTAEALLAFAPACDARGTLLAEAQAFAGCADERLLVVRSRSLLGRILSQIIPPAYAGCKESVRAVLLYMHTHYTERITLEDIAQAANLDRSYLCRLFKRETNINLFAYLNDLRMNAAARLIESGGGYVREIANRVGIEDPFYFTRLFKKHFGVNPSAYRGMPGDGCVAAQGEDVETPDEGAIEEGVTSFRD